MRALIASLVLAAGAAAQDVVVRADLLYTMEGEPIPGGVVLIRDGKIDYAGRDKPDLGSRPGLRELHAAVVMPGLVDAHSVVGLTGYLNQPTDQDQLDPSAPIQPELRAVDAYNCRERLIEWVRGFGVTTMHTGHGPGALISGQTMIVKTRGDTVDEAVMVPRAALACTLGPSAEVAGEGKSPGTAGKEVAMLREQLLKAQTYRDKRAAGGDKAPDRDLRLEALADALDGKLPLMITAQRHQDIESALRLQKEFGFRLWLDGGAESYLLVDEIRAAGVPVIVHPAMQRAVEETQNLSFDTAGTLHKAGIPIALQSGFEDYVPKTRVLLYEAGVAAAHGLGRDAALRAITLDAAKLLGVDARVGSLAVGKDGDLALYDGDPLEYTTHCVGTVIDGVVVFEGEAVTRGPMALLALCLGAATACRAPEAAPPHDVGLTGAKFVEMLPDITVPREGGGFRSAGDQLAGLVLAAVADWPCVEPQADERDAAEWSIGYGFCLDGPLTDQSAGWRVHDPRRDPASHDGVPDPASEILLSRDAAAVCAIGPRGLIIHPADIRLDDDPMVLVALPGQFIALQPARETWWRVRDIEDRGWHEIICTR